VSLELVPLCTMVIELAEPLILPDAHPGPARPITKQRDEVA
jgi:hypothetical protein